MAKFDDYLNQSVKACKVGGPKNLNAINAGKGAALVGVLIAIGGGIYSLVHSKKYPYYFLADCVIDNTSLPAKTRFRIIESGNPTTIELMNKPHLEIDIDPKDLQAMTNISVAREDE